MDGGLQGLKCRAIYLGEMQDRQEGASQLEAGVCNMCQALRDDDTKAEGLGKLCS